MPEGNINREDLLMQAVVGNKSLPITIKVKTYLESIGAYRYNVRSNKVEVMFHNVQQASQMGSKPYCYTEITDRIVYTIWMEMQNKGIEASENTIYKVLYSNFSPEYDPVKEFLDSLTEWDGVTDYIKKEITDRIKLVDETPEKRSYLERNFKKWAVRMVKAWLEYDERNEVILLLIGSQHTFKTTFFEYLLPEMLKPYYKGNFSLLNINKDTRIELAENLFILIDDMDQLDKTKNGELKNFTSLPFVKERRAYGRNVERLPHNASFGATSNVVNILVDPTGNRRWLVFHVSEINPSPHPVKGVPFNYEGIYSQIKALIEQNFDYEMSDSDISEQEEFNQQFMVTDMARELVSKYYAVPNEDDESVIKLSASEILGQIVKDLRFNSHLRVEEVGTALNKLGFGSVKVHGARKYIVKPILPSEQIKNQ